MRRLLAFALVAAPAPAAAKATVSTRHTALGTVLVDGQGRTLYLFEKDHAGHPLSTYAGDAKPGQTKGQDLDQFGPKWYVLRPSGQKIDDDEG